MFAIPMTAKIAAAAFVGGIFVGGYVAYKYVDGNYARAEVQQLATTINDANTAIEKMVKQTREDAAARSKLSSVIIPAKETVIRETLQPIYTTCVITPDSVRNFNDQIRAINSAISGAGTLPTDKRVHWSFDGRATAPVSAASGTVR